MKKIFLTIILAIAFVAPSCGHSQKVNESANTELLVQEYLIGESD